MIEQDLSYFLIRVNDLYLVPICLVVLYFFANIMHKKYKYHPLQKYILPALTIRFVCALLYTLVIGYYYGFGDSHNYYQGVLDMHKAVEDNPSILMIYMVR
jgi:urea transporter